MGYKVAAGDSDIASGGYLLTHHQPNSEPKMCTETLAWRRDDLDPFHHRLQFSTIDKSLTGWRTG